MDCISGCIYVSKGQTGEREVDGFWKEDGSQLVILQEHRGRFQEHLGSGLKVPSAGNTQLFQSQEGLTQAKLKDPTSLLHKSCSSVYNSSEFLLQSKESFTQSAVKSAARGSSTPLTHNPLQTKVTLVRMMALSDDPEAMVGQISPENQVVGCTGQSEGWKHLGIVFFFFFFLQTHIF